MSDNVIIDHYIDEAADERTILARNNFNNKHRVTIDEAHMASSRGATMLLQRGKNAGMH